LLCVIVLWKTQQFFVARVGDSDRSRTVRSRLLAVFGRSAFRGVRAACKVSRSVPAPILSVFPALIVHSELKSVHPGFPRNHENTMPETAFLGAEIAQKSLSAGASPQTRLGELTALPQTP